MVRPLLVLCCLWPLAFAGCYSPGLEACSVQCASDGSCPSGSSCRPDGFCAATGTAADAPMCPAGGRADGGVSATDARAANGVDAGPGSPDGSVEVACSLVPQAGCDQGACDFNRDTGNVECRAITVAGGESNTCLTSTECGPGFHCLGGSCRRWCDGDGGCGGAACVLSAEAGLDDTARLCASSCDPFSEGGCPPGMACRMAGSSLTDEIFALCTRTGSGGQGALCASSADCRDNFSCMADVGGTFRCAKHCDPSADLGLLSCLVFESSLCVPFEPKVFFNGVEAGVCALL